MLGRDRYGSLRLAGWWSESVVRSARVVVVGAGALGNEVVKNLVLMGVGTILLVDFDEVEMENLDRGVFLRDGDEGRPKAEVVARRATELNPAVRVVPIHGDVRLCVGGGTVREADLVFSCVDNREARLWINSQCHRHGTRWVDGAVQGLDAVVRVFRPPAGACYECSFTDEDYRLVSMRYSCPLLPRGAIAEGKVPVVTTAASIGGALQVQLGMKLLHGMDVPPGHCVVCGGSGELYYRQLLQRRENCPAHETWEEVLQLEVSVRDRVSVLSAELEREAGGVGGLVLQLPLDVAESIACASCGWSMEGPLPLLALSFDGCPDCGGVLDARMVSSVALEDDRWSEVPLSRLGLAPRDVVMIRNRSYDEVLFVALGADEWGDASSCRSAGKAVVGADE